MPGLVNGIRALNIASFVLFLFCCYYMCVSSEHSPGALTVVEVDDEDDSGELFWNVRISGYLSYIVNVV